MTLGHPIQASLLRLSANGISVFSPHSALDNALGGINDWLAAGLISEDWGERVKLVGSEGSDDRGKLLELVRNHSPGGEKGRAILLDTPNSIWGLKGRVISWIKPFGTVPPTGQEGGGIGRLIHFAEDQQVSLDELVGRVKSHLGLDLVQVASPAFSDSSPNQIKSVAICAGSGSGLFSGVEADCYFTGEMDHHSILAAVARGSSVILCNHSNSERPYLPFFRKLLSEELNKESSSQSDKWEVLLSREDKDPLVPT